MLGLMVFGALALFGVPMRVTPRAEVAVLVVFTGDYGAAYSCRCFSWVGCNSGQPVNIDKSQNLLSLHGAAVHSDGLSFLVRAFEPPLLQFFHASWTGFQDWETIFVGSLVYLVHGIFFSRRFSNARNFIPPHRLKIFILSSAGKRLNL